jgi:Fe-S cluster assembly protein SufB
MSTTTETIEALAQREYKYGFVTDIEQEFAPPGLNEDIIRFISAKKNEPDWMLEWRLKSYRYWRELYDAGKEPDWAFLPYGYGPIDYQAISYYAAPKKQPDSLDEVDPELLKTYEKLGIPLEEQKWLAGVAVDAVFDSVSVATTFQKELEKHGVIFCPFSEALHNHPALVRKYLGSVVPHTDNFFAALNSAVFSDGSFVYVPKGVRCPMELSTYFRINAAQTGQFARGVTSATWRVARRRCETRTSYMRRSSSLSRWTMPPSNTRRSRTGILVTRRARAAFTTSSPSAASVRDETRTSRGRRSRLDRRSPGSTRAVSSRATILWANSTRSR